MKKNGTPTSACNNVNDVAGGRKAQNSIVVETGGGGEEGAVLVSFGIDDAVVFAYEEVESVPSLETEDDDEEEEEEEEEDDWESGDEEEDADLDEGLAERLRILDDARSLKILAVAYLHPEKGIFNRHFLLEGTDPAVFGRNYFNRHSAPDAEEFEVAEERARVLAEAAALKKAAAEHMHPEVGVASADGACFGRNYFERYSAPETEDDELADERVEIMDEMAALKKLVVDYLHPEVGVKAADATLFGRNYFHRYSAPETEDKEVADERARVLAEAAALKKLAVDYLHPELGVKAADATLFGRNYFNRYSAPETEEFEVADERARVLAEAAALKKSAMDYLHPEVGVKAADATWFGRNYFERYSAPETEEFEVANERARVLAEAAALKKSAVDYFHPEVGVKAADATWFGRNYFNRYSAPETEEFEVADERARVLAEAAALKKSAVDYLHPEVGVKAADATLFGRNYFNRYSAPETEDDELADERAEIMDEMAALKKLAVDYFHPEMGVKAADATLFGRNYFNRHSAPETEAFEVAEERARVLAEAAALKKSAVDYLHPEVGVKASDATLFGRNYFNRYSALETEDDELTDERAEIMDEMATLKKLAVDYLHPEVGVKAADATLFGRNYFNRYSAPETEDEEVAEEGACVLAEAAALKKLAMDYMHPEVGVTSTDSACFGRNYFMRYSAPEVEDEEVADERAEILEDAAALKRLAAVVKGANLPNIKSAKLSSSDSNVGATKKSASTVNLFGLSEEVF